MCLKSTRAVSLGSQGFSLVWRFLVLCISCCGEVVEAQPNYAITFKNATSYAVDVWLQDADGNHVGGNDNHGGAGAVWVDDFSGALYGRANVNYTVMAQQSSAPWQSGPVMVTPNCTAVYTVGVGAGIEGCTAITITGGVPPQSGGSGQQGTATLQVCNNTGLPQYYQWATVEPGTSVFSPYNGCDSRLTFTPVSGFSQGVGNNGMVGTDTGGAGTGTYFQLLSGQCIAVSGTYGLASGVGLQAVMLDTSTYTGLLPPPIGGCVTLLDNIDGVGAQPHNGGNLTGPISPYTTNLFTGNPLGTNNVADLPNGIQWTNGTNGNIVFAPGSNGPWALETTAETGFNALQNIEGDNMLLLTKADAYLQILAAKSNSAGSNSIVINLTNNIPTNLFFRDEIVETNTGNTASNTSWDVGFGKTNVVASYVGGFLGQMTNGGYGAGEQIGGVLTNLGGGVATNVPSGMVGDIALALPNGPSGVNYNFTFGLGVLPTWTGSLLSVASSAVTSLVWYLAWLGMYNVLREGLLRAAEQPQVGGSSQSGLGTNADTVTGLVYAGIVSAGLVALAGFGGTRLLASATVGMGGSVLGSVFDSISSNPGLHACWNVVTAFLSVGDVVGACATYFVFTYVLFDTVLFLTISVTLWLVK